MNTTRDITESVQTVAGYSEIDSGSAQVNSLEARTSKQVPGCRL